MFLEKIPDEDRIHRHVDRPTHFDTDLIWEKTFQFQIKKPSESVVWSKYAPTEEKVHIIGLKRVEAIKECGPGQANRQYVGYISSVTGNVRSLVCSGGSAFSVDHAPDEGQHHAEITIKFSKAAQTKNKQRLHRDNLRLMLKREFSEIVRNTVCSP